MNAIPNLGQQPQSISSIPLEDLGANKKFSDEDKLKEVSRQFESILLKKIFQEGRKTVFKSAYAKDTATSGMYDDMVNQQLADATSRSGEVGLARSLQHQLVRQVLKKPEISGDEKY